MSYRVMGDEIYRGNDDKPVEMTQVIPRQPTDPVEVLKPKVTVPGAVSDPDVVLEKTAHISLHQAAREGRKDIVEQRITKLRRHGAQKLRRLNKKDENKLTALHYAVRYGHLEVVKLLIDAGASVNIEGDDGATPIHYAARFRAVASTKAKVASISRQVTQVDGGVNVEGSKSVEDVPKAVAEALLNAEVLGEVSLSGAEVVVEDESIIDYLVENSADVNCGDKYGLTPLHYACNKSNVIATKELLRCSGIAVDKKDKAGCTPLHCANNNGSVVVSQALIEKGAFLRSKDEENCTPLHYACMEGYVAVVKLLLAAGEENGGKYLVDDMIKDKDRENQSILHVAVDSGYLDVVELLVENGADVNAVRNNLACPLHLAAISGQLDIAKHLVEHGADIEARNSDHETPLHKAASYNRYAVANFLIDKGADVDARDKDNFTPLLMSSSEGHTSILKLLLDKGANLQARDIKDKTAIYMAAEENCQESLKVLLEQPEANILINESDMYEDSPLHIAASKGYVGATAILLKSGARIDARNDEEHTPLHVAAKNGRTRTVRELLKGDPSIVNDEDEASNTALHHAAMEGHNKCVTELLTHGAAVDARNATLWTPLDCAAAHGWSKTVNVLLDFDSPVDPTDKTKTTPLHLASKNGHIDVVTLLLSRNADISLLDHSGRNCLDLAIEYGRKDVAMAIIQDENWELALKNKVLGENGRATTPMRKLILRLPDVAEEVFNKCVEDNSFAIDHPNYKVTLNYEFLEDIYMEWDGEDDKDNVSLSSESITSAEYDCKVRNQKRIMSLLEQKKSHPLMVMVRSKRVDLLGHPLVTFLLNNKWKKYGRYVYYGKLMIYCVFLLFLTGYVVYGTQNTQIIGAATSNCSLKYKNPDTAAHTLWIGVGRYVILFLCCFQLVLELFQGFYQRKYYLTWENLMEWATYVLALVYVSNDFEEDIFQGFRTTPCGDWRQSVGAMAIFMAWINLVLFIRKFPMLGIYVVMFTDILATFSRLFIIFVLFIISFSLAFFTLLYVNGDKTPAFKTPFRAIMKSSVMMIGEFDFDSLFNNDPSIKVPPVTWALFAVFVIIMTLLLMNLLIGLAVDDIKGVQDQAVLKRQAMQVDLALDVEKALPRAIRRRFVSTKDEFQLNVLSKGIFSWFTKPPVSAQEIKEKTFPLQTNMERLECQNEELKKGMNQLKTRMKDMKSQQDQLQAMLKGVVTKLDVLVDEDEEDEEGSN